jgi:hypothetical protein
VQLGLPAGQVPDEILVAARGVILSSTQAERDYYAANDRNHFGDPTSPGSQFTDVNDTESLVALAHIQRGHLDGDDRDELIALDGGSQRIHARQSVPEGGGARRARHQGRA